MKLNPDQVRNPGLEVRQQLQLRLGHRHGGERFRRAKQHAPPDVAGVQFGDIERHTFAGPAFDGVFAVNLHAPDPAGHFCPAAALAAFSAFSWSSLAMTFLTFSMRSLVGG